MDVKEARKMVESHPQWDFHDDEDEDDKKDADADSESNLSSDDEMSDDYWTTELLVTLGDHLELGASDTWGFISMWWTVGDRTQTLNLIFLPTTKSLTTTEQYWLWHLGMTVDSQWHLGVDQHYVIAA